LIAEPRAAFVHAAHVQQRVDAKPMLDRRRYASAVPIFLSATD
jgi:hypothetical protein